MPLPAANSAAEEAAQPFFIVSSGSPLTLAFKAEAEQIRVALTEEAVDVDVIANDFAGPGRPRWNVTAASSRR